jgi:soluble lytic murein transglycosylase-like protein
MSRWLLGVAVAIGLAACSSAPDVALPTGVDRAATSAGGGTFHGTLAAPEQDVPTQPAVLARRLTLTTAALRDAIDAWRSTGGADSWPPPDEVVLLALDQQRIYQVLAGRTSLRSRTIALLPRELRAEAQTLAAAGARLASGSRPVTRTPRLDTRAPAPADLLRAYYDEAEARFGVDWELLAAVHFIETRFGRVVSGSSAGALGPMQFIPSTWKAYGMGGDVRDPHDAILGAANYLSASGAPSRQRRALLAYNPVDYYADAVALYARQLRRDPDTFYAFYNWQVFVRTPDGDIKRLTGPGV